MSGTVGSEGPITEVREGMRVVDAEGTDLGTVSEVRMSDAGAVTGEGQQTGGGTGLIGVLADALGGGDALSEHSRERLVRLGYVRIDASGLFAGDRYAASDEIARVAGDAVHLTVAGDRLVG